MKSKRCVDFYTQDLAKDDNGHIIWQRKIQKRNLNAKEMAILICDMWDQHWSRGATERVGDMAPKMNQVVESARAQGMTIIHAPSDTIGFYEGTPARERIKNTLKQMPLVINEHPDFPLPIDDSDEGSDTDEAAPLRVWTRQHTAIRIDQEKDVISDDGVEIYNYLREMDIRQLLLAGVHTNMCILNRSFGIKQMVKWGMDVALIKDLTDAMYNPARPPYVSHEEGTKLVIEYIEKFWCPTVLSSDLV